MENQEDEILRWKVPLMCSVPASKDTSEGRDLEESQIGCIPLQAFLAGGWGLGDRLGGGLSVISAVCPAIARHLLQLALSACLR